MERARGTSGVGGGRAPGLRRAGAPRAAWALALGLGLAVEALAPRVLAAQHVAEGRASAAISVSATVASSYSAYRVTTAATPAGPQTPGGGVSPDAVSLPWGAVLEVAGGLRRAVRVVADPPVSAGRPQLRFAIEYVAN